MFVVLHHMFLGVWDDFPRNVGPGWLGWLLYGHLAVAVFIVVSGFSLALAPMRRGGTLSGGTRRFLRRRAWRIIPPYWAALVVSTITALILTPSLDTGAVAKGFVVHGLLLQDIVGSLATNGAFWSIAVEWQIYFVFPLILLLGMRTNFSTAAFCTVALVLVAHAIAGIGSPYNKINHLTAQFLALFALGVLAVQLGQGDRGVKLRRPLTAIGLLAIGLFVAASVLKGSVWVVNRYFWFDLIFGAGIACLMAVMFSGGLPRARRLFASRVGVTLGLFSYSIYLVHGPVLAILDNEVIAPLHLPSLVTFGVLLLVGIPVILVACYGFHLVFEAPFLSARDASAFRAMPGIRRLLPKSTGGAVEGRGTAPPAEVVVAPEAT